MAKNTSLYLRIGEAKNLPIKDLTGSSDPYCVVTIDNEQVARTSTVWRSLCPFWGEEYTLHLPNSFHHLTLYIYDQDVLSGDDIIGKVTIPYDQVKSKPKGVEKWYEILHVDGTDLQGEIHLEVGRYTTMGKHQIKMKVIEARDLTERSLQATSSPYVRVSFNGQQLKTHKIKGSRYPVWDETFIFDIPEGLSLTTEVVVSLMDFERADGANLVGQFDFQLNELPPNETYEEWFHISNDKSNKRPVTSSNTSDNGTMRIKTRLTEERILPSQYYQPLIELLVYSLNPDKYPSTEFPNGPTPLSMLQEIMTIDLMELANTLVKLYIGQGKIMQYLEVVCREEISNTTNPNNLFRSNSLATKSVDQFMKIVGMPYLHETLSPVIDLIYEEHKAIELDPARLDRLQRRPSLKPMFTRSELIVYSTQVLVQYLTSIKERVFDSLDRMPLMMRVMFKQLRAQIEQRWPGDQHEEQKYIGVSGFLFLRFLAPAILAPKLFSLRDNHPDGRTGRTLTLVAKAIQSLGNLGLQLGRGKETWTAPIHPFIHTSVPEVKSYINKLVSIQETNVQGFGSTASRHVFQSSVTIKQGPLRKRQWNSSVRILNSLAFRKRYFWLKHDMLAYAKKPADQVRNNIPTARICAVERVDSHAFSQTNVAQVISCNAQGHQEMLYFQAKDINDMYLWLSSIRKTLIMNENLLDLYHPGTYKRDAWTCCSRMGKAARGCSKTHSLATIGDWRDPLDPDAEAQTIYSQLYLGRDVLKQKYSESSEAASHVTEDTVLSRLSSLSDSVPNSPRQLPAPATKTTTAATGGATNATSNGNSQTNILQKSASFRDAEMASVGQLLDVIMDLEKVHDAYEKMELEKQRHSFRSDTSQIRE